MKIYLDTCSLQRPLDNKTQIRVSLEAEAVLGILSLCEAGELALLSSDALIFEIKRTPQTMRRDFGLEVLSKASTFVSLNETIENRARVFESAGLKPLDALHLAFADVGGADYLCTCDDKFLKRARTIRFLTIAVVTPLELIEELEK